MGRIDKLAERYRRHVALPWQKDPAGAQRAIFVVYDKADERRLRARKGLFELATTEAGHGWIECDLIGAFAEWMAGTEYRESYFESPEDLGLKLEEDFLEHAAGRVRAALAAPEADEGSVVAVFGVASLFGFARVSELMRAVEGTSEGVSWCSFRGSTKTATTGCSTRGTGGATSRSRSRLGKITERTWCEASEQPGEPGEPGGLEQPGEPACPPRADDGPGIEGEPAMKNRDVYQWDPFEIALLNNGVATVTDALTGDERRTLRFELTHFVCEGQYRSGLVRILESCVRHQGRPEQPAAWISGFFGSGKSHLAKMLRFLWTDYAFPEDGARARGLARLPDDVLDLFTEVSTLGRRGHGLHAAAGTLGAGAGAASGSRCSVSRSSPRGSPRASPRRASACGSGRTASTSRSVTRWRRHAGSPGPALQWRPAPEGLTPSRRTDGSRGAVPNRIMGPDRIAMRGRTAMRPGRRIGTGSSGAS